MSITVFGSLNMDLNAYVVTLPRPGVTAHAQSYTIGLGGKGTNQAVAAQRLSERPVRLIAAIGADAFGIRAQELLDEFKVSTEHLMIMPGEATGIALIHVDANHGPEHHHRGRWSQSGMARPGTRSSCF